MILPKEDSTKNMPKDAFLTVSLEEFGLSKYEAQAYVTLIEKGTISASEVAYYSELPRTKVYPILLKLQKKKLAIISKSKPIMCTGIAPEDAFDGILQEQIEKVNAMNTLVTNLKKVSEESKKARGAEERRYFHLNASNVLNQLQIMIEGSKSSISIITDASGLNLLAECKEQLLSVLRREIDVKIILPQSLIGSESFKKIPEGAKIRMADVSQNCFIFDETELLIIDSNNGKGAVFSSTEVLGETQISSFNHIWKNALKTRSISDFTKSEAQEVCKIINVIGQNGLGFALSSLNSKQNEIDFIKLLEKNGVNLKTKSLEDVIELIDSTLQITCSGHINFDQKHDNITVESKLNSGHSLPWVTVLTGYLNKNGYKTKLVSQNNLAKGEKVHIKITSK